MRISYVSRNWRVCYHASEAFTAVHIVPSQCAKPCCIGWANAYFGLIRQSRICRLHFVLCLNRHFHVLLCQCIQCPAAYVQEQAGAALAWLHACIICIPSQYKHYASYAYLIKTLYPFSFSLPSLRYQAGEIKPGRAAHTIWGSVITLSHACGSSFGNHVPFNFHVRGYRIVCCKAALLSQPSVSFMI